MKTCYKNDFLDAWGIVKNAPRSFNVREPMLEGFCKFCLSKENPIIAENDVPPYYRRVRFSTCHVKPVDKNS